jgi:hypothetical protein
MLVRCSGIDPVAQRTPVVFVPARDPLLLNRSDHANAGPRSSVHGERIGSDLRFPHKLSSFFFFPRAGAQISPRDVGCLAGLRVVANQLAASYKKLAVPRRCQPGAASQSRRPPALLWSGKKRGQVSNDPCGPVVQCPCVGPPGRNEVPSCRLAPRALSLPLCEVASADCWQPRESSGA